MVLCTKECWFKKAIYCLAPYAKTVKVVESYFSTAGYDDIALIFSRCVSGYDTWHYTPSNVAEMMGFRSKIIKYGFDSDMNLIELN